DKKLLPQTSYDYSKRKGTQMPCSNGSLLLWNPHHTRNTVVLSLLIKSQGKIEENFQLNFGYHK
ncbi:MAG: hypothetical protein II627_03130, partial [Lachnospiraceae bacterium]|nr:hypothetical protein [Lachnospiraceae bacterium]